MTDSLSHRRVQYETAGLDIGDLLADPVSQWQLWYDQAVEAGCVEPNAMALSTVDAEGVPDLRYVLARGVTATGFVFYTNYDSAKSRAIDGWPRVAGLFTWLQLLRQMKIRGAVSRVDDEESAAYFATRPRSSQVGAWASPQSQVLTDRAELEARVAEIEARFIGHETLPRPHNWGGWRIGITEAEVWQGRPNRLHDRFRYRRSALGHDPGGHDPGGHDPGGHDPGEESGAWIIERLAP